MAEVTDSVSRGGPGLPDAAGQRSTHRRAWGSNHLHAESRLWLFSSLFMQIIQLLNETKVKT